jgi:hypothetical protein
MKRLPRSEVSALPLDGGGRGKGRGNFWSIFDKGLFGAERAEIAEV